MSLPRLPPLHALVSFAEAARLGSFAATAEALHLTPSAVSHRIKALEEHVGRPLFARVGREVRLTQEGRSYAEAVDAALEAIAVATARVAQRPDAARVNVSVTPAFASGWLVPHLPAFQLAHPDVEVRLDTTLALVDFARSDIDLAVRYGGGQWPGLASERLMGETLVPVCSPALLAGPEGLRTLEDLRRATLIHVLPRLGDWRNWAAAAGLDGLDAEHGPKFDTVTHALAAASGGLGVAIAVRRLVAAELADGRLVIPFEVEIDGANGYYLVAPEGRDPSPAAARFRAWLLERVADAAA